jgi:hypothetical protein
MIQWTELIRIRPILSIIIIKNKFEIATKNNFNQIKCMAMNYEELG